MAHFFLWLLLLVSPQHLRAEDVKMSASLDPDVQARPQNYVNLRAGFGSDSPGNRPSLCLEVAPVYFFAVEACGSGRGFLYNDPGRELSHFRAKWKMNYFSLNEQWLVPELALGFAELEVGEDQPGFRFAAGNSDQEQTSAAGPELSVATAWLHVLPKGFEILGNLNAGLAWLPTASTLTGAPSPWQPFVGLTLGLGW